MTYNAIVYLIGIIHVRLFVTPWTVANPAPLSMQEYSLQARIPGWVDMPRSRGSSQPRDRTLVSHTAGRLFTSWATREAQEYWSAEPIPSPVDLPDPGIELGSPALHCRQILYQLSYQGSPLKPWFCIFCLIFLFFMIGGQLLQKFIFHGQKWKILAM